MKTDVDVKKYRKEKTLSLIDKYKSLIDDTFNIFDNNIAEEGEDEKEQDKLNRIKKRSGALEQVQEFLTMIEGLEHHLKEIDKKENGKSTEETEHNSEEKKEEGGYHPTKRRARK